MVTGLLEILGNKRYNISKMLQDTDIVIQRKTNGKSCTAYQITQIPMTLSEFGGHCFYERQNTSRGPFAFVELHV